MIVEDLERIIKDIVDKKLPVKIRVRMPNGEYAYEDVALEIVKKTRLTKESPPKPKVEKYLLIY